MNFWRWAYYASDAFVRLSPCGFPWNQNSHGSTWLIRAIGGETQSYVIAFRCCVVLIRHTIVHLTGYFKPSDYRNIISGHTRSIPFFCRIQSIDSFHCGCALPDASIHCHFIFIIVIDHIITRAIIKRLNIVYRLANRLHFVSHGHSHQPPATK